jgi:oligopeptide transport system substrate-binding protein
MWSRPSGNVQRVLAVIARARDEVEDWRRGRYDLLEVGRRDAPDDPPGTVRFPSSMLETTYLGFRIDRFPVDDERVRRALAHALDRERFRKLFNWDADALGGLLPPAVPGHSHKLAPAPDLEAARALLADAGYEDGRGLPPLRLALTRPLPQAAQFRRDLEEAWEAQWQRIGVRLEIEWIPGGYVPARGKPEPEDLHLWVQGWTADYPDPDGFLATFLEENWVLLDETLEMLLGRARSLSNRDERLRLYREADRLLVSERMAAVPLHYEADVVLVRPWIEGFWANPIGYATCDQIVVHDRNKSPADAGLSQLRG